MPSIHPTAYIHPQAVILGDVSLGAHVSVWPTAVLRGDSDRIVVGDESNVQDGSVLHADHGLPAIVGKRVAIGHRAIVHGAVIEDGCLIGMGCVVLNGARVGAGSIIGAGAVVTEGMQIPPGSLVLGVPARVVKPVTPEMTARIAATVDAYLELKEQHRSGKWK
ncbi:MAG TPA: gamma carbonic anhydrase family protein [Gemmatimonadaceae bacterium]|nr:gamma carbonic anhydrase family protein [Gemmatimonadaceae bacterium]